MSQCSWAEEDDFEYGGRSTRSVSHSLIITLLPLCDIKIENFVYVDDIKVSGSLFLICVCKNMILFWT